MPIREFKCKAGHVTEKILMGEADQQQTIRCDQCKRQAKRLEISTVGHLSPEFGYVNKRAESGALRQHPGMERRKGAADPMGV